MDGERSTLSADGVVWLDQRLDLDAAAARTAHLRLHAGEPALAFTRDAPCDEQVAAAMRAEERAHDLEVRVARELGAGLPDFGLEGLEADYRRRCERAVTER